MTDLETFLRALPGRCAGCGSHVAQGCRCVAVAPTSEWALFVTAVKAVAAENDGTVYQSDRPDGRLGVRSRIRGRVEPKHIGQLWRRARSEGLVRDTGEREQSDDIAGRNADKLDRVYALGAAA